MSSQLICLEDIMYLLSLDVSRNCLYLLTFSTILETAMELPVTWLCHEVMRIALPLASNALLP